MQANNNGPSSPAQAGDPVFQSLYANHQLSGILDPRLRGDDVRSERSPMMEGFARKQNTARFRVCVLIPE
jgi:hypothetical protein